MPFVDVQGSQAITSFPMEQACELVASEARFAFALDAGRGATAAGLIEDAGDAVVNLLEGNGGSEIFFPVVFR